MLEVKKSKGGKNTIHALSIMDKVAAANTSLLPFKSVNINGVIEGPLATLDIELKYQNPWGDRPIECSYEFPLSKNTILSQLKLSIKDKVIFAEVKNKKQAQEEYKQAIKDNLTAVLAERDTKENESMTIKLGNIGRGEEATLEIQLIFRVDIVMGSYKFFLPADFYPDYRNLGAKSNLDYGFNFVLEIKSTKKITWISLPPNSKSKEMKSKGNGRHFVITCKKPT